MSDNRTFVDGATLAVRHVPDELQVRPDGSLIPNELDHGLYEVGFLEPDGTFVVFAHVKGGKVFKQRNLAAARNAAAAAAAPPEPPAVDTSSGTGTVTVTPVEPPAA